MEDYDGPSPATEDHSDVLAAVMALEPKYRVSIYLYYYEGYSVREVAKALGEKESTVQTRLARAREKLKKTLSGEKEAKDYA